MTPRTTGRPTRANDRRTPRPAHGSLRAAGSRGRRTVPYRLGGRAGVPWVPLLLLLALTGPSLSAALIGAAPPAAPAAEVSLASSPAPLSVVTTIELPPSVGVAVGPPVLNPATGDVYVPDFATGSVEILHGSAVVATVTVSGNPVSVVYDPANGYVYVAATNTTSVTVVNGTTVVGVVPVAACASYAGQGAYDAGNGLVYLPNPCTGNVSVVNGTSVVATIPLVAPTGSDTLLAATYDPGDGLVYVSYPSNGVVLVLNGTTYVGRVNIGGWPNPGTYDGSNGLLYVTDSGTCNVSLLRSAALVTNLSIGGSGCRDGFGGSAVYDPANGFVYLSYEGGASFHAYVAVLNGTVEIADLDAGPHLAGSASYGAFGDGTGFVYQTTAQSLSGGAGAGSVLALGGRAIVGTLNLTSEPAGVVYDPTSGYVYLPAYTPANTTTGLSGESVIVVDCTACQAVTFSVQGAPAGAGWNLTALNGTTGFAEALGSSSASITLRLENGTYRLLAAAPAGATVVLTSGDAVYDPAQGTVRVGVVPPSPAPGAGFLSERWWGVPAVGILAAVAVFLSGGAVVSMVLARRTLRREGEELVERMREAIERGTDRFDPGS